MTIEIQPDDEHPSTFIITLYSGWTWADVTQADETIREQADANTPTHIFVEIDAPIAMPDKIEDLAQPWLSTHANENGGLLVFITQWAMIQSLFRLLQFDGTSPLKMVRFAKDLDEAREFVREWDAL